MNRSSGILFFRRNPLEVCIVRASGSKEMWGIPKGLIENGETAEEAARREVWEETGVKYDGKLVDIGSVVYSSKKKKVYCFLAEVGKDFKVGVASWEIDRAEFLPIDEAFDKMHKDQREFLKRLRQLHGKE